MDDVSSRKFGMIAGTYQICLFQNHFAIAQAVCSKSADFRRLDSSEIFTNNSVRSQRSICKLCAAKELGTITDTYQNTPFSKPCTIYSPGFFALEIGRFWPIENVSETSANNPLRSWKPIFTHVGDVWDDYRGSFQNPPFLKPWTTAVAFC